jgi:hypothetical protein
METHMSDTPKRPRILLEMQGGVLQNIHVDGDVEIVAIDYDNVHAEKQDDTLTVAKIEEFLRLDRHEGTTQAFDAELESQRDNLFSIAGLDPDDLDPPAPSAAPAP